MDRLFEGEPQTLPPGPRSITALGQPEPPHEVTHAAGYEQFVQVATHYGTSARDLFDLWRFAHFIRAHAGALAAAPDLQHSAVVFAATPSSPSTRTSSGSTTSTDSSRKTPIPRCSPSTACR